jgi:ribosomal protein S18 acetylase RimI-like enzyme
MLSIIPVQPTDLDTLLAISRKTFHDAFYHICKPADYEEYTSLAFQPAKLLAELKTPNSYFYFVLIGGQPAAYLKLNFHDAQTEFCEPDAMEIQRIYVLGDHQGKQIGKHRLDFATEKAKENQMKYMWLGVWEINVNAVRFYENNGFKIIGKHTFPFGDEVDTDWLMRKEL